MKTLLLISASSMVLYWHDGRLLTFLLVIILLTVGLSAKRRMLWPRMRPLIKIGFLILIFQLVFNQSVGWLDRLSIGLTTVIRLIAISMLVFTYMATTSFSELISLFGFFPPKARLLLAMTFYFIPSILKEAEQISLVQKTRGAGSNPLAILVPLLHRVFARAETLSLNIVSRGYEE